MASNLIPIEHLVQHAVLYLQDNGYSYSSVKRYHKCWKTLLQVCQQESIRYFCYEQCLPPMLMEWQIDPYAPVSPFQRFQIRSLKGLRDFQDHGKFLNATGTNSIPLPFLIRKRCKNMKTICGKKV